MTEPRALAARMFAPIRALTVKMFSTASVAPYPIIAMVMITPSDCIIDDTRCLRASSFSFRDSIPSTAFSHKPIIKRERRKKRMVSKRDVMERRESFFFICTGKIFRKADLMKGYIMSLSIRGRRSIKRQMIPSPLLRKKMAMTKIATNGRSINIIRLAAE